MSNIKSYLNIVVRVMHDFESLNKCELEVIDCRKTLELWII